MIKAFQCTLAKSKGCVPVYLQTNKGKNLSRNQCKNFLKKTTFVTRNPDQSRHNSTLKEMWRYFTHKNTLQCFAGLCALIITRVTRPRPRMQSAIVTRENACIICENITCHWKNEMLKKRVRKIKYCVGNLVCINREESTFEKGYETKWSKKIFRIYRVLD